MLQKKIEFLNIPAFRLHKLKEKMKNLYSVSVQANWHITFEFKDENVYVVDYLDYHLFRFMNKINSDLFIIYKKKDLRKSFLFFNNFH